MPQLPPKTPFRKLEEGFVERRRVELAGYLQQLVALSEGRPAVLHELQDFLNPSSLNVDTEEKNVRKGSSRRSMFSLFRGHEEYKVSSPIEIIDENSGDSVNLEMNTSTPLTITTKRGVCSKEKF